MARKPQSKEVASVAAFNEDGMLLFARRRDSGKWTLPGGHIEEGESAEEGAVRELLEETGLSADSIEVLGHCDIKDKNLTIYSFQVTVPKDEYPEDCNDPDEECDEFRWVNPDVIPPEVNVFAQGNHQRIKPIIIPTDKASGSNMPVNKDRLNLYTRMLRGGDDVPPVVVRQAGPDSYYLIDGNHRQAAAQATGKKQIRAYLLQDVKPPPPSIREKKFKKSELGMARIKPMNRHLPFLMHLEFHPHDNEVWVENNSLVKAQTLEGFEKLIKGKKDGLKMYGPTPTPEQKAHVDWSYSKLPNENWATWSIRNHRANPSAFTPEVKEKLEHYALHPSSDIQNIRFDKGHDLKTGLQTLQDADSLHKLKGRLAEKPETAKKIIDLGDDFAWWDLGKSQCSSEGEAMEHCGNTYDPQEGDNVLSLRKKHVIGGKTYYEPHVTFVENNGVFTEMRGRNDTKPSSEYHRPIAELLKRGHIPVGLVYSGGNFHVDDFSDELYDEVKKVNPKISLYRRGEKDFVNPALLDLYARKHPVKKINNLYEDEFFSKLTGLDSNSWHQSGAVNMFTQFLKQNPDSDFAERLARLGNLPPELLKHLIDTNKAGSLVHARAARNKNIAPELLKHLIDRNGAGSLVHEYAAQHKNITPELLKYLVENNKAGSDVHVAAAQNKNIHPDVLKYLVEKNEADSWVHANAAENKNIHPEVLKYLIDKNKADSLVHVYAAKNQNIHKAGSLVHVRAALNQNIHPELLKYLIDTNEADSLVHEYALTNPNLTLEMARSIASKTPEESGHYQLAQEAIQRLSSGNVNKSEAPLEAILAPNLEHSDRIEAGIRVATAMLGLRTSSHEAFEAAKFLAGGKSLSFDQIRRAIYNNDGDLEAAALQAYGLENNESNKRAIRAVIKTKGLQKSIDNPIRFKEIEPALSEGHDAADSIKRASESGHIHKIILHSKHSQGSMLAFDLDNDVTLLLKPDFGGAGPASGAQEESASLPRREAAFWHVAKEWSLSKWVPQTDLVLLDGKEFAAIHVLPWSWQAIERMREENLTQVSSILNKYLKSGTLHKWAVLDFVLGNTDRHGQNAMGDIETGELALIDHGSAMAGPSFDPAHDKNSFVPFYLRFLTPGNFNSLTVSDKLKRMPHVDNQTNEELVNWVVSLDAHELQEILYRYGIDSHPALQRLTVLREMVGETGRLDQSINRLWVTT
ncbi:NUDIX domain-containing protein [bacterium]|nr:NUDIX domain-containing protein [bacterium]